MTYGLVEELAVDSPLRDPGAATDMEQTDEDRGRVTAIKRLQTLAQQDRISKELEWQLCMDYQNGEIFLLRNRWTGELTRFRIGENRTSYSKNNIIRPINRALIAKLTRMMPAWTVQATTNDYDETFSARACEAILRFVYTNRRMDIRFIEMIEYVSTLGDAFIIPEWSMDVGKDIAFCPRCNYKAPPNQVGQPCQQCAMQEQQEAALKAMLPAQATPPPINPISPGGGGVSQPAVSLPPNFPPPPTQQPPPPSNPLQTLGGSPQPAQNIPELQGQSPMTSLEMPPTAGSGSQIFDQVQQTQNERQNRPQTLVAGKTGGVVIRVGAPWEGYVEPNVRKMEDCGWFIYSERVAVHEARRRYPWAGEFIHADTLASDVNAFKFLNSPLPDASGYVTIYKYFERGTQVQPQGRVLHMCNWYIVQNDSNSVYDVTRYLPICHFTFERNLKLRSLWGRSWILDGHHHQRELSNLETLMKEYGEKHVRFKILTPHGANMAEDDVTGPNLLVKFSPGVGQPTPMQLNQMPEFVPNRKEQLISDCRAEAGVSDMDTMQTSDPNARAMSIVQAESLQQMKYILVRIYSEWAKLGYIILAMYQKYGDRDELYTTLGGENPETFSVDDIVLTPGVDIAVEIEDGLSTTQPVRLQEATSLAQIGNGILFTDPTTGQFDVASFAQYAHLKMPNVRPDEQTTEYAAAMQMIHTILHGGQTQPSPVDDPAIFQLVLLRWLRGKGRRMIMTGDPQKLQIVQQIQQLYGMYVMQEMQQKMQQIASQAQQSAPPGHDANSQAGGKPGAGGGQVGNGQSGKPAPNQLQRQGSAQDSSVLSNAGNAVQQADRNGEEQAKIQQNHEG